MPGFGAAKESQREIPIARIEDMQRKGLTNNQIIQTLQRDGYSSTQIFDALNQANMQPTHQMGAIPMEQSQPPWPNPTTTDVGVPNNPNVMPPPPQAAAPPRPDLGGAGNEELIEAIIDEKWSELVKSVNKIVEWKEAMDAQIQKMDQRMEDLKGQFDKVHEGILGKVAEYDKNILEVGAEVKAMEKVFSKVLPVFTENVAELSRITDRVKGAPKAPVKK